jgi:putative transposase
VRINFGRRGTPGDNARCEAFNGSVRRECLAQAYFWTIAEARHTLTEWKPEYNNHRPHRSLGDVAPAHFRASASKPQPGFQHWEQLASWRRTGVWRPNAQSNLPSGPALAGPAAIRER